MREILLFTAVLLLFLIGFFAVKTVERVFSQRESAADPLRVGFLSHALAGGMKPGLETFSAAYPDVKLQVIYGTNAELIRALEHDQLDVIVVSESSRLPSAEWFHIRPVPVHNDPGKKTCVLWKRHAAHRTAGAFAGCLSGDEAEG